MRHAGSTELLIWLIRLPPHGWSLDRKRQAIPCHQNFQRLSRLKSSCPWAVETLRVLSMVRSLFVVDQSAHNVYLKEMRAPATSQKRNTFFLSSKTCICYQMMLRAQKLRSWIAPWWFSSSQLPAKVERTSTQKTMNNLNPSKFLDANTVALYLSHMYHTSAIHCDSRFVQFSECNRVIDLELSMFFLPRIYLDFSF